MPTKDMISPRTDAILRRKAEAMARQQAASGTDNEYAHMLTAQFQLHVPVSTPLTEVDKSMRAALKSEYAHKYLEKIGAMPTRSNVAMVERMAPIEDCHISTAWRAKGHASRSVMITPYPDPNAPEVAKILAEKEALAAQKRKKTPAEVWAKRKGASFKKAAAAQALFETVSAARTTNARAVRVRTAEIAGHGRSGAKSAPRVAAKFKSGLKRVEDDQKMLAGESIGTSDESVDGGESESKHGSPRGSAEGERGDAAESKHGGWKGRDAPTTGRSATRGAESKSSGPSAPVPSGSGPVSGGAGATSGEPRGSGSPGDKGLKFTLRKKAPPSEDDKHVLGNTTTTFRTLKNKFVYPFNSVTQETDKQQREEAAEAAMSAGLELVNRDKPKSKSPKTPRSPRSPRSKSLLSPRSPRSRTPRRSVTFSGSPSRIATPIRSRTPKSRPESSSSRPGSGNSGSAPAGSSRATSRPQSALSTKELDEMIIAENKGRAHESKFGAAEWKRLMQATFTQTRRPLRLTPKDIALVQKDFISTLPFHLITPRLDAETEKEVRELLNSLPVTRLIGLMSHYIYWKVLRAQIDGAELPEEDMNAMIAAMLTGWGSLEVSMHGDRAKTGVERPLILLSIRSVCFAVLRSELPMWFEYEALCRSRDVPAMILADRSSFIVGAPWTEEVIDTVVAAFFDPNRYGSRIPALESTTDGVALSEKSKRFAQFYGSALPHERDRTSSPSKRMQHSRATTPDVRLMAPPVGRLNGKSSAMGYNKSLFETGSRDTSRDSSRAGSRAPSRGPSSRVASRVASRSTSALGHGSKQERSRVSSLSHRAQVQSRSALALAGKDMTKRPVPPPTHPYPSRLRDLFNTTSAAVRAVFNKPADPKFRVESYRANMAHFLRETRGTAFPDPKSDVGPDAAFHVPPKLKTDLYAFLLAKLDVRYKTTGGAGFDARAAMIDMMQDEVKRAGEEDGDPLIPSSDGIPRGPDGAPIVAEKSHAASTELPKSSPLVTGRSTKADLWGLDPDMEPPGGSGKPLRTDDEDFLLALARRPTIVRSPFIHQAEVSRPATAIDPYELLGELAKF